MTHSYSVRAPHRDISAAKRRLDAIKARQRQEQTILDAANELWLKQQYEELAKMK